MSLLGVAEQVAERAHEKGGELSFVTTVEIGGKSYCVEIYVEPEGADDDAEAGDGAAAPGGDR